MIFSCRIATMAPLKSNDLSAFPSHYLMVVIPGLAMHLAWSNKSHLCTWLGAIPKPWHRWSMHGLAAWISHPTMIYLEQSNKHVCLSNQPWKHIETKSWNLHQYVHHLPIISSNRPLCSPGSAVPAVGHAGPCSRAGTLEFLSASALGHPVLSKRFQPSAPRRRMVPLKKWIPSSPCPRKNKWLATK